MTPRALAVLAAVGAAALAGGWYFGAATKPQQVQVDTGQLMFPGLAARLKDAARIEIVNKGKTTVLAPANGVWGLADKGGYRVIDTKIRGMLTALTELRLMEPRTADPDQLKRLGVDDPRGADSNANLLRLLDAQGKPILEVVTGHRRVRTQAKVAEQVYVRRPGETQAWLAEGSLQVDADPQLWLEREVANIESKRIVSAETSRAGGETLKFARKDDKLALVDPAEHPPLDEYRVDDVARALEFLNLQDVQPDSAPVGEAVGQGVFATADGLTATVRVFKGEKDIYARLSFSGADAAKAEADKLNAKTAGWTYQLGAWKEKAFAPTLEGLKKSDPAPQADPPPAGAAGGDAKP